MTVYKIMHNAVITFYLDILKFNKKWENKTCGKGGNRSLLSVMRIYALPRNAVITFLVDFINLLSQTHSTEPTPLEYGYPQVSGCSQGGLPRCVGAQEPSH